MPRTIGRPTDLLGCALWLDASQITGLSDGQTVGTWPDLSGNGRDATQATEASKPTYRTNVLNGKPVVRFDGTNDALSVASNITDDQVTAFVVVNRSGAQTGYRSILRVRRFPVLSRSDVTDEWGVYLAPSVLSGVTLDTSFRALSLVLRSATDVDLATDGSVVTKSSGGAVADSTTVIGNNTDGLSQHHAGDIAEIVVYNRALTGAERRAVERYLAEKWALRGAPFRSLTAPTQIPGCNLWLAADRITGLSDGQAITTWSDGSGQANHVTQATEASKPSYRTNVLNGKPVVRFDGADYLSCTLVAALQVHSYTWFCVAKWPTAAAAALFCIGGQAKDQVMLPSAGRVMQYVSYNDSATNNAITGTASLASAHRLATMRRDVGRRLLEGFVDGANDGYSTLVHDNAAYTGAALGLYVGARAAGLQPSAADTELAEVIVFSRALGDGERRAVERYLADKYAITVAH